MTIKKRIPVVLVALLLCPLPLLRAQQLNPEKDYSTGRSFWPMFSHVYKSIEVPGVSMGNSPRLDQLVRGGKLYLSLSDAMALTLENNLDIAYARYGPTVADSDILRAKSGSQLRGVQTQISTLSTGQSAGVGPGVRGQDESGITTRAGGGGVGGADGTGDASTFFGTQAVNLDPTMFFNFDFGHFSNPQTSNFVTGNSVFVTDSSNYILGVTKGFLSGTQATVFWATRDDETNSLRQNFNPSVRTNMSLQIRQPLLQGFGTGVNSRNIRVAKNNREVSDLAFKQQVIVTVTGVQNLYWDLVSFISDVESQRDSLRLAEKLYQDNKRRVEVGTLAPIEIVRAEAEVAARQEDVTVAVTRVQLQETLLKNALSRNGLASPSLIEAEIVPTDPIVIPEIQEVQPIQDLMATALQARPELAQDRIRLHNRDINMEAIRNGMLPQVDVILDLTNNGLAGQQNPNFIGLPEEPSTTEFFLGGLGRALGQVYRRNFPDYQIRAEMRIPIKNRRAQADMAASLLEKRQVEIRMRQSENAIRAEVQNALIGVQQARARLKSASKSRELQEQTLEAEQKKFNLGASTIFLVVQAQRDLSLARSIEIGAENNWVQARVELDRATGQTLAVNRISLEEAYQGSVSKPPDALPPPDPSDSAGAEQSVPTASSFSRPSGRRSAKPSAKPDYLLANTGSQGASKAGSRAGNEAVSGTTATPLSGGPAVPSAFSALR